MFLFLKLVKQAFRFLLASLTEDNLIDLGVSKSHCLLLKNVLIVPLLVFDVTKRFRNFVQLKQLFLGLFKQLIVLL